GATGVAKVRALSAGFAGRVAARGAYVRFAWMGDMVTLRYARWRDGRATRAIAARSALAGRATPLRQPFCLIRRVANLSFSAHPPILQIHLRVGVTIGLLGIALPSPTSAYGTSLPARLREGGVAIFDAL